MDYRKSIEYFPNGTQLYSKRPIEGYPEHYNSASGITILSEGIKYKDFSNMSVGSCILGYADTRVNLAVIKAIENGNISTLNSELEIELAELLLKYEPNKMFKYCRGGGEALSIAVRAVRSYSGRDVILTNGYNGWCDWYLAGNYKSDVKNHIGITTTEGVPFGLNGTCYYWDTLDKLKKLISELEKYGRIAGIVVELARYKEIDQEIIEYLKTTKYPIIIDEITTGWRATLGGYYKKFGLDPDVVVYGKAISNGYGFSVVCGKKDIMKSLEKSFVSSTYWSDNIGMVAAIATIKELEKKDYFLRNKLENKLREHLEPNDGFPGLIHYYPSDDWQNKMLQKGYLVSNQIMLSFAHSSANIDNYITEINGGC